MAETSCIHQSLFSEQSAGSARAYKDLISSLFLSEGSSTTGLETFSLGLIKQNTQRPPEVEFSKHSRTHPVGRQNRHSQLTQDVREVTTRITINSAGDLESYLGSAPCFRAFFIKQSGSSYSPLSITYNLFENLLLQANISAQYRDYILYFGERDRDAEIVPPVSRLRALSSPSVGQARESHDYECMYGLRFMELNGRDDPNQPTYKWSFRQSAIYCKICTNPQEATWVFTSPQAAVQCQLDQYIHRSADVGTSNSFEIHLLLFDNAIANWRYFLVDLAAETDQHSALLLGTSPDNPGPISLADCGRRQELMVLDEKMLNTLIILRSTIDTLRCLNDHYRSCQDQTYGLGCATLGVAFYERLRELEMLVLRVEGLQSKLQNITALLSSFLDLNNGFAIQKLTEKGSQDTVAMKVLTILTLIYLPATVVSNFFSTCFVRTESPAGKAAHIVVSGDWWIFVAASLPLTMLTFYIWLVWTRIQAHGDYPLWWRLFRCKHQTSSLRSFDILAEKV
jgi:Mg2+ and Co2+ transporter CorA